MSGFADRILVPVFCYKCRYLGTWYRYTRCDPDPYMTILGDTDFISGYLLDIRKSVIQDISGGPVRNRFLKQTCINTTSRTFARRGKKDVDFQEIQTVPQFAGVQKKSWRVMFNCCCSAQGQGQHLRSSPGNRYGEPVSGRAVDRSRLERPGAPGFASPLTRVLVSPGYDCDHGDELRGTWFDGASTQACGSPRFRL